ncbi:phosphonate ABC transporter ATP-binding protein [Pelagibacterales bacterium SAG-MED08]|nr:phosphonate ABC transporter ATP-binding protein [Pelagibacterales bacterium SAG-MED44]MBD1169678.1 phosphonate ABC transporter ATP-binding protein [Pelagibacterales bacterium SAG-MED08]
MRINKVNKFFGNNHAVKNVSFEVNKPQMIGIIGRSGAGKSTLLRIINRLTDATDGEIEIDGQNILQLKSKEKRSWQRNCAMIFQQFNLVPRLDVLTNVILGRLNYQGSFRASLKMFSRDERADALILLNTLGMANTALQRAETLSGGQQQRVAICRALMQNPKMILADEPIASLDPMNARMVMESLRKIHDEKNLTVISNLHTLDTAKTYCDRIIGMKDGAIVFDDLPEKLSDKLAREIYGAEADEAFEPQVTSTELKTKKKINGDVEKEFATA